MKTVLLLRQPGREQAKLAESEDYTLEELVHPEVVKVYEVIAAFRRDLIVERVEIQVHYRTRVT